MYPNLMVNELSHSSSTFPRNIRPFIVPSPNTVFAFVGPSVHPVPGDKPFSFACRSFRGTVNRCDRLLVVATVVDFGNCQVECLIFHL